MLTGRTTTVAIIGAAGRRHDAHRLTSAHFSSMVSTARCVIQQLLGLSPSQVHLVSGGSSYADHVAVVLYVQSAMEQLQEGGTASNAQAYAGLTLHLPAPFHPNSTAASSVSSATPLSSVLAPGPAPDRTTATTGRPLHACGCAASVSYAHPHFLDNGDSSWKTNPGRVLNEYHSQFSSVVSRGAAVTAVSVAPGTQRKAVASRHRPSTPLPSDLFSQLNPPCRTALESCPVSPSALGRASSQFSSFHDLCTALALGAELRAVDDVITVRPAGSCHGLQAQCREAGDAFHRRNSVVARSQHLIAFTFGGARPVSFTSDAPVDTLSTLLSSPSNQPCPGGTADTWNKCQGNRIHIPLHHLFSPHLTRCLRWSAASSIPPPAHQPIAPSHACTARPLPVSAAPSLSQSIVSLTTIVPAVSNSAAANEQQRQQRRLKRRYSSDAEDEHAVMLPKKTLLTSWLQSADNAGRRLLPSSNRHRSLANYSSQSDLGSQVPRWSVPSVEHNPIRTHEYVI